MRNTFITIILIISMLLISCSSNTDTTSIKEELTQTYTSIDESNSPQILENSDSSASLEQSILFIENEDDNRILLLESEDYLIDFIVDKNILTGQTMYNFEYTSKTDYESSPSISIKDIRVNGTILLENEYYLKISDAEKTKAHTSIDNIESTLTNNNFSQLTNLSGVIKAVSPDYSMEEQFEFDIKIPASIYDKYFITPYKDALATAQTILSNEVLDIDLIAFGAFSRYSVASNSTGILLSVTNKSDHVIPFRTQSAIVNGWCFDASNGNDISPGMTSHFVITLEDSRLKNADINSIFSLDLLLITDYSENTSISENHMRGGNLYPVSLSKSGVQTPSKPEGTILYQSDKFTIYEDNLSQSSSYIANIYYFIVENNSSDIISCNSGNGKFNGENCIIIQGYYQSLDGTYIDERPTYESIPPGAKYSSLISFHTQNPDENYIDPYTLAFELYFYTAGGGKLIETSDVIEVRHDDN